MSACLAVHAGECALGLFLSSPLGNAIVQNQLRKVVVAPDLRADGKDADKDALRTANSGAAK